MGRYNEIVRELDNDPEAYAPILWEGPDGEDIAMDWAEGFAQAVALRPEAWRPLLEDREALVLLMPILALCGDEEGGLPLGLDPEAEAGLLAEAPGLIPACVVGIHDFWEEHRGRPTAGPDQAKGRKAKVGRNELWSILGDEGQAAACSSAAWTGSPSRKRTPAMTWARRSVPSRRRQWRSADLASL
jgi:hypothetical protein